MQRISYEDSGIITDTRGQRTGTVTIQSANDSVCNVSIPDGGLTVAGLSTLSSILVGALGVTHRGVTGGNSYELSDQYPVLSIKTDNAATAVTLGLYANQTPQRLFIFMKPHTAGTFAIATANVNVNGSSIASTAITGLMSGRQGVLFVFWTGSEWFYAQTSWVATS